jgi:hypothetical protein
MLRTMLQAKLHRVGVTQAKFEREHPPVVVLVDEGKPRTLAEHANI